MTHVPPHDAPATIAGVLATISVAAPQLRRFGTAACDLDVDFEGARPVVVTELLRICLGGDAQTWWRLPVHARIVLAVALAELATGEAIEVTMTCGCGEVAAVQLTAHELATFARERSGGRLHVDVAGLHVRLPTGEDQLRWRALGHELARAPDLARRVLEVLADDVVPPERVVEVERALADADPLIEFLLETACPACTAPLAGEIDLEALALGRLRRVQRTLLEDVHVLALAYHWNEADIAGLPAWRRAEYLAFLGRGRA
jgi:hypothetical protein